MTAITNSMFTTKPRIRFRLAKHHASASSQINEKATVSRPLYDDIPPLHQDYRRQMICDVCTAIDKDIARKSVLFEYNDYFVDFSNITYARG